MQPNHNNRFSSSLNTLKTHSPSIGNALSTYLKNLCSFLISPEPPYAEPRVAMGILSVAAYVIAKQLQQLKLDSFGSPMIPFALGSTLTIIDSACSLPNLKHTNSSRTAPDNGSPGPNSDTNNSNKQTQKILKTVSAALGLAGSIGLFIHWALSQSPSYQNSVRSPAINVFIPLAFAAGNIFKLLLLRGVIPEKLMPYGRTAILSGMTVGAVLFQESARTQFKDSTFFVLATIMTSTLAPQLLHSWAELAQQLSTYLNNRSFRSSSEGNPPV